MKTLASLVGVFLAVIVFGALLGLSITLLFAHTSTLVVGGGADGLSMERVLGVLLFWVGVAAISTTFFTIVYTIRYPQNGLVRIVTHTVLCLLVWLLILPVCLSASQKFTGMDFSRSKEPTLTPGYFRPYNSTLYYYSSVNEETKTGNGVSFRLNNIDSATDGSYLLENVPLFEADIAPFSDVLIYDTLTISKLVDTVLPALYLNQKSALEALEKGVLPWLVFATWGLALCALIGVRRLFQWRLLNFCTALLGFLGICVLNLAYSLGWDGNMFGYVTLPCWVLNCIIAGVLSCMGILLAIFRPDPNMEHEE